MSGEAASGWPSTGSTPVRRAGRPVEAMRSITSILIEHQGWSDEHREMAPPVAAAAASAGAFVLSAPREVGGWEAPLPEILEATEELGAADPTVAWHSGNSHALGTVAAYLSPSDRSLVFADSLGPFGFSVAMKGEARQVDDGFLLSGRWPMVTGALSAPWVVLAGAILGRPGRPAPDGPVESRLFIVPACDFAIERTWDSAPTMRGTGSHAVILHETFVPEGLAHSWLRPKVIDRPLYSLPTAFGGPVNNAAIAVGILRAAVRHSTELVAGKASNIDGTLLRDRGRYANAIASGTSAARALKAGLLAMAEDVWSEAEKGRVSKEQRAHMWSTAYWTLDRAREALSDLTTASTSAVYSRTNPTEAGLRDLHAICAAMETLRDLQDAAGRVFLGQPPGLAGF